MRILIVEDELTLAEGLAFNFQHEGYQVDLAGDCLLYTSDAADE